MESAYWRQAWEAKAEEPDFTASGRSSGDPRQLFAALADVCAALDPNPDDLLMDLGCGVGLLVRHLVPYVRGVVAADFAVNLLRRAQRQTPTVRFVAADVRKLPFRSGNFPKVLVSSVLQYLGNDDAVAAALEEVRRVTARGGRAFASGNPDRSRKKAYIAGIDKLDLPEERKSFIRERNRKAFWLSPETLLRQAEAAGWTAEVRSISPVIWQSFYMFDLLLIAR